MRGLDFILEGGILLDKSVFRRGSKSTLFLPKDVALAAWAHLPLLPEACCVVHDTGLFATFFPAKELSEGDTVTAVSALVLLLMHNCCDDFHSVLEKGRLQ